MYINANSKVRRKLDFEGTRLSSGVYVIDKGTVLKGPLNKNEYLFLTTLNQRQKETNCLLTPYPSFEFTKHILFSDVPNTGQQFIDEQSQTYCYVSTPYCSQGDLRIWLENNPITTLHKDIDFVGQMLSIVAQIQALNLLHLDISIENFVVSNDQKVLIVDGGFAMSSQTYTHPIKCGKINYLDPCIKYWQDDSPIPCDFDPHKVDAFALGVTLLTYVTKRYCFQGELSDPMYNYLLYYGSEPFLLLVQQQEGISIHPIFFSVIQDLMEPDYSLRSTVSCALGKFAENLKVFAAHQLNMSSDDFHLFADL